MSDFERSLLHTVPLEEASSFFIRTKYGPEGSPLLDSYVKEASSRFKSAAQQVIDDLLAGRMPEGKAGRFGTPKEASAPLWRKLAFGEAVGQDPMGGQPAMQEPMAANAPPAAPPALSPPREPVMPINYLGAESLARRMQSANEVNFYRERMMKAISENAGLQQAVQDSQAQLSQLQQTADQAGQQIQASTDEAVAASDRALQAGMEAANLRIGVKKLQEQILQVATQDPDTLGTMGQQAQAEAQMAEEEAAAGGGAQAAGAGTPEGSPPPGGGAPPGSPPASVNVNVGAGDTASSSGESGRVVDDTAEPTSKTASAASLVGGLAGASLGARAGHAQGGRVDATTQRVQQLEQQPGGFLHALRLAAAKADQAVAQGAAEHPTGATLAGAGLGALAGTAAVSKGGRLLSNLKRAVA